MTGIAFVPCSQIVRLLTNCSSFGEAVTELTRTSMVCRLSSSKGLSLHRIVQLAVFHRLTASERVELFDLAVCNAYFDFPNTWKKQGAEQGHDWTSWNACSVILPRVSWLMQLYEKYKFKFSNFHLWAELVFRAGT